MNVPGIATIAGLLKKIADFIRDLFLIFVGGKIKEASYEKKRADSLQRAAQDLADDAGKSDADIANELRREADSASNRD